MSTATGEITSVPDSHVDLLETEGFAHLASLGPDGEPHSHPVWYGWDGEHLKFSTTKQRQKFTNVRRDPRVAVTILDPEDPYRYVELRGEIVEIEDDPGKDFIDELAQAYMGQDYPMKEPDDDRVILHLAPTHVVTRA